MVITRMGLSNKLEEQLRKMPKIEAKLTKSKDGRFLIEKVVITTIRPVAYMKAVLENTESVDLEDVPEAEVSA
jgi:hypothetical protein